MKQDLYHARRAAALLIAAAALPLTPVLAQDTQPAPPPAASSAPPPAAQVPTADIPPPAAPVVAPAPAPAPVVNVAPPAEAAPNTELRASTPPARSAARVPVRAPSSFATASRPLRAAPTTVSVTTVPAPAPVTTLAPAPVTTTAPPAIIPAPEPAAVAPAPIAPVTQPTDSRGRVISALPWVIAGIALLGIIAFVAARRRRRTDVYERDYVETPVEPVMAAPVAAAPVMAEPIPAPAIAAAAPVAAEHRRPWIDLQLEPVRAGVEGEEAVVEFALKVDNRGGAPARDVRVSTFMLQAGASDAERSLIAPTEMPAVTIAAGESKQVETAVALPTDRVQGDAVLPVVVADARYTLPDGSEGRTSASFAVGIPDGEELAHFAVDNPSGLHEGVVARALGEMEKA